MSNTIKNCKTWGGIKWTSVHGRIFEVQCRIYKAQKSGNLEQVHWLQKQLLKSNDAKLYAVHQVTTLNKGKKTAGVDRIKITKDSEKLKLAESLHLNHKADPIRRVWIPKPGKTEKRPLGIPTIRDRAKQALAKLALEPQWEAIFEPNSYGFRPGRRAQDAIEAIFLGLRHGRPKWVFDADIAKCFDKIDHEALLNKLNTFPRMREQIRAWLKAGIMEGYANRNKGVTASEMGTPQGGIISPLLANIALHGLEQHLKDFVTEFPAFTGRGTIAKQKALTIVRYADDFVVIHPSRDILEKCITVTKSWLKTIGLEISAEKSALRISSEGFRFLGFQIINVVKGGNYKVKIMPSSKNVKAFSESISEVIKRNKAISAYDLINILRPKIIGWANYFRFSECSLTFNKLTHLVFLKLRAWVFRRDTRNGKLKVKQKYFPSNKVYNFNGTKHRDNWILNGTKKSKQGIKTIYLPHMSWITSIKHVKIKDDASPFNGDKLYWAIRNEKYSGLPLRVTTLYKKQKGYCNICKVPFNNFSTLEVDHITPKKLGGKDQYNNLQLIHRECHIIKTRKDMMKIYNTPSKDFFPEIISNEEIKLS